MKNKIKQIGLLALVLSGMTACQGDDMTASKNPCGSGSLETVVDDDNCNIDQFFLICEVVEVPDLIPLENDDFDWIPMLCKDVGETVEYKNSNGQSFDITITDKDNYVHKSRVNAGCDASIEHVSYICQSNEKAFIEFSSPIFGNNITRFELYRWISEVKDGKLGDDKLRIVIGQPRTNTNVYNFLYWIIAGDEYDNRSRIYHDQLILNGENFSSVYEFLVRETYWADPHISMYVNQERGLLGFKKDSKFWLK